MFENNPWQEIQEKKQLSNKSETQPPFPMVRFCKKNTDLHLLEVYLVYQSVSQKSKVDSKGVEGLKFSYSAERTRREVPTLWLG